MGESIKSIDPNSKRIVTKKKHLTKRRYVGNTMAALVMQTLGCDVAALNTVQFST